MDVFWRLILAHFVADFTFQTNHVANWKRESRWGMVFHVVTHPVTYAAFTWSYISQPWVVTRWFSLNGWICIGFLALFHWIEDEWRVWSIQETGSPDSTKFFLADQLVHIVMILAFAPIQPGATTPTWVFVALCLVLLSHFTSVLVFFLENDMWGRSEVLQNKKYIYIGERIIGAAFFLLPGIWMICAIGWLGYIFYLHYHKTQDRTWVHTVVGNVAVVLLGLISRGVLTPLE
jgi:hypothetical protein